MKQQNTKALSWEELDKKGMMLKGFTKSQNELRVQICRDCGPLGALLYVQLLSHHNRESGKCFPSISTLEKETCISRRKINDLITDLYNHDYIIVRSGGRNHSNTYWFPKESLDIFDPNDFEAQMAYKRKTAMNKSNKQANNDTASPVFEDIEEDIF